MASGGVGGGSWAPVKPGPCGCLVLNSALSPQNRGETQCSDSTLPCSGAGPLAPWWVPGREGWPGGWSLHSIFSTTGPDFDRSQWLNEKFKLGLDFPNVGAGSGGSGRREPASALRPPLPAQTEALGSRASAQPQLPGSCGCFPTMLCAAIPSHLLRGPHSEPRLHLCPDAGRCREGLWGSLCPPDLPLSLPSPLLSSLQLPYLIDGTRKLTQSNAILRYIARKHNLCEWGWGGCRGSGGLALGWRVGG